LGLSRFLAHVTACAIPLSDASLSLFCFVSAMENGGSSEDERPLRTYMATAVPAAVRTAVARVAPAFKAEGVSYKRQREIYSEAGYEISATTFRRHLASVHGGEAPLSTNKRAGRPRALTDREAMIFVGWVLMQNDENDLLASENVRALSQTIWAMSCRAGQCITTW
jgi:hypothetical protein